MIETEKATDHLDLPHAYVEMDGPRALCICSRPAENALHGPTLTEQASHRAPLIETEKGS